MKSYTDLEQSKRLIELGLDVETSDMHYIEDSSDNPYCELYASKLNEEARKRYNTHYIPAWSLSALLELMPFHIIENNVRYEFQIVKGLNKEEGTYKIKYKSCTSLFETIMYNNLIDAAFEMVVWLKENEKL